MDHLAFGDLDGPERNGKTKLGNIELHVHLADAHFADEGMGAGIAALGGIGERKQETLVAARQRLQAQIAVQRKFQWLAGKVARHVIFRHLAVTLDQAFASEDVGDPHH